MAALLVGDDIISTNDPARLLVVASPEGILQIEAALTEHRDFFRVDACSDLQSAREEARSGVHDAVVVNLQLPDAWPGDAFNRVRQEVEGIPILVIARARMRLGSSHDGHRARHFASSASKGAMPHPSGASS